MKNRYRIQEQDGWYRLQVALESKVEEPKIITRKFLPAKEIKVEMKITEWRDAVAWQQSWYHGATHSSDYELSFGAFKDYGYSECFWSSRITKTEPAYFESRQDALDYLEAEIGKQYTLEEPEWRTV